jgi:hypothetical protein
LLPIICSHFPTERTKKSLTTGGQEWRRLLAETHQKIATRVASAFGACAVDVVGELPFGFEEVDPFDRGLELRVHFGGSSLWGRRSRHGLEGGPAVGTGAEHPPFAAGVASAEPANFGNAPRKFRPVRMSAVEGRPFAVDSYARRTFVMFFLRAWFCL